MAEIPPTRASLLVRLRDPRDEAAWTEFVDLYGPLIYGYARKQGLQDADAADLSQEVLGAVAGAAGRLEYDPRARHVSQLAVHGRAPQAVQLAAAQKSRPRGSGDTATHRLLEQCPVAEPALAEWEAEWEQRLFAWACEQVRREVTEVTWQAFWRTAIDGQPGKQVAADLGLSVAAVYLARSRVLARLKELVQSVQEP